MHKSTRAAIFVFVCLVVTVIAGLGLFLRYSTPRESAVALLAGCALVAFVFAVLAIRITFSSRRSRRLELDHGVPPSRVLRALELRQWLILTLGIAFVAVATGAGTALGVVGDDEVQVSAEPTASPTISDPPITPAFSEQPTSESAPPEPTEQSEPSEPAEPDPGEPSEDAATTKYLDNEEPLDGGFADEAVNFSAKRYPRGINFWCSSVTSSRLQWNVAGYRKFTTVAGIDDRTEDSFGAVAEFLFYDEDGRQLLPEPVEVSMGKERKVSIDLTGVVSLVVACAGRNMETGDQRSTRSAFGDPVITR